MINTTFIIATSFLAAAAPQGALAATTISGTTSEIRSRTITYSDDAGVEYKGYFAWDDSIDGPRPGILIIHAWWGLGEEEKTRARMLAELGYAAFALDMYGNGKHTSEASQAGQWAGVVGSDRGHARRVARLGLDTLAKQPEVNSAQLAGIGYCFGGTNILELAYSGAPVKGVVSFHGNPKPARADDVPNIKASLLVCHGDADSLVPPSTIDAFTRALAGSPIDWQLITYAHAKHAFTSPSADGVGIAGVGYNELADKRSWEHMKDFFEEIFAH